MLRVKITVENVDQLKFLVEHLAEFNLKFEKRRYIENEAIEVFVLFPNATMTTRFFAVAYEGLYTWKIEKTIK